VLEWLRALAAEDRQALGRDLRLVEMGWPSESAVQAARRWALGGSQQAVAEPDRSRNLLRFAGLHDSAPRLHQEDAKTPQSELNLARARQKEVNR